MWFILNYILYTIYTISNIYSYYRSINAFWMLHGTCYIVTCIEKYISWIYLGGSHCLLVRKWKYALMIITLYRVFASSESNNFALRMLHVMRLNCMQLKTNITGHFALHWSRIHFRVNRTRVTLTHIWRWYSCNTFLHTISMYYKSQWRTGIYCGNKSIMH